MSTLELRSINLQHWYVYHSTEIMGYDYSSLKSSAVYSTSAQPKLCFNDVIWVIEGDKSNPKNFKLVDCFINKEQRYPPFSADYAQFKLKAIGEKSLIKEPIKLSKEDKWFAELHSRFITKQKFFSVLPQPIFIKLLNVSGVNL